MTGQPHGLLLSVYLGSTEGFYIVQQYGQFGELLFAAQRVQVVACRFRGNACTAYKHANICGAADKYGICYQGKRSRI